MKLFDVRPVSLLMLREASPYEPAEQMSLAELTSLLGVSSADLDDASELEVGERTTVVGCSNDEYNITRVS